MGLTEAIAAAQTAGHTTPAAIYAWLAGTTGTKIDNGRTLGLADIGVLIGPVRAGVVLATLQGAAGQGDTTALFIVAVLTTGGTIQPGLAAVQGVLASLVTATVLAQAEADALIAAGQRDQIRAELYGLPFAPTPYDLRGKVPA